MLKYLFRVPFHWATSLVWENFLYIEYVSQLKLSSLKKIVVNPQPSDFKAVYIDTRVHIREAVHNSRKDRGVPVF